MRTWDQISAKDRSSYRACDNCGNPCARRVRLCRLCSPNVRGKKHYAWKGDEARPETKRERAQKMFELRDCERCGARATDRHHIDGDPGNNVPENIMGLCRRCHMVVDGRLATRYSNGGFRSIHA